MYPVLKQVERILLTSFLSKGNRFLTFNKGSEKSEEIMDAGMLPGAYVFPW